MARRPLPRGSWAPVPPVSARRRRQPHAPVHRWQHSRRPAVTASLGPHRLFMHCLPKIPARAAQHPPCLLRSTNSTQYSSDSTRIRLPQTLPACLPTTPHHTARTEPKRPAPSRPRRCALWLVAATAAQDAPPGPASLEPGLWKKSPSQPQRIHDTDCKCALTWWTRLVRLSTTSPPPVHHPSLFIIQEHCPRASSSKTNAVRSF